MAETQLDLIETPVQHPIIHCLFTGQTGVGKTQLASTFPKPMLVHFWDGFGNDHPYTKLGPASELQQYEDGTPWREVQTDDGIILLEYYHDADPTQPDAMERYLGGLPYLNPAEWRTIVFDSVSEASKTGRWWEQFALNKNTKDKRQHWAESADNIERIICGNFKSFACNTVVIAHLSDKLPREDAPFWPLDLSGRLSTSIPRAFGEVYCLRFVVDDEGRRRRVIQTEGDGTYFAKSHLDLPMYVDPHYESLWHKEEISVKRIPTEGVRARRTATA